MSDLWTTEQITAHATWLRRTHGDSLESLTINETAEDHGINTDGWHGEQWDAYGDAVQKILNAAPDLTDWAINLGADGLEPSDEHVEITEGTHIGVRIHFAFDPDLPQEIRQQVINALRQDIHIASF